MPQYLVWILLALALVVPVAGAIGLRLLGKALNDTQRAIGGAVLAGAAIVSVLLLGWSDVSTLQIGDLKLLLPVARQAAPIQIDFSPREPDALEDAALEALTPTSTPTASPTVTPTATPTLTPTVAVPITPTSTPTLTPTVAVPITPTSTPTLTPTVAPEPAPAPQLEPAPQPAPEPAQPTVYVVQSGDTLRGIAEDFGVSVEAILEASGLTPEEGDAIRPGQELIIP